MSKNFIINKEQQKFLSEMFDTSDIFFALEQLQILITEERGDSSDLEFYIPRLMKRWRDRK